MRFKCSSLVKLEDTKNLQDAHPFFRIIMKASYNTD